MPIAETIGQIRYEHLVHGKSITEIARDLSCRATPVGPNIVFL